MGKISHHRISRIAVQSASGRRGAGCPGPVAGIGDRRMLPQRLQGDLRLRRRIDLPSRLRRHHPLRLSQQNDPLLTTPRSHFPGPAHSLTASRLSFNQRISSIPERGEIPRRSRRCNRGRRRQGDEPATGSGLPCREGVCNGRSESQKTCWIGFTKGEIRWKGFRRGRSPADVLHCASEKIVKKSPDRKPDQASNKPRPAVIAIRKTCDAEGTGLSHYVLMDKQVKR